MSDNAQADLSATRELEILVHHLADELAGFRRRAQAAEARIRDLDHHAASDADVGLAERCAELETENEKLRARLETATARAKQMLERVRFLRQQAQSGPVTADR
jgi:hypothetical protein